MFPKTISTIESSLFIHPHNGFDLERRCGVGAVQTHKRDGRAKTGKIAPGRVHANIWIIWEKFSPLSPPTRGEKEESLLLGGFVDFRNEMLISARRDCGEIELRNGLA